MRHIKATALLLVLATFSMAAQASLVTWDFSWERTARSNVYNGIGMFSYESSAGNHVTHGGTWWNDLDDELTAFSFEGFVNGASIGVTNALPGYFDFSADLGVIWALSANRSGNSDGAGVGCLLNLCSLYDDGDRISRSLGHLTASLRDHPTALAAPGLLGLTMAGMWLGLWRRRRTDDAIAT